MHKVQSSKFKVQSSKLENQLNLEPGTLNFELFYELHGTGESLLLIPGFAQGAWSWKWQIEELSKDFQVITFDPPGVSRSKIIENSSAAITMQTIADDVLQLLNRLEIEKADVLGVSFGGFVAQEFALAHPDRLNKLILASTSFGGKNHVAPNLEVLAAFVSSDDLNKPERIRKFLIPAFTPEFFAAHAETVEEVCRLREQNLVPETAYLQQLQAATSFDAEQRVSQIAAETLVLTGDKDAVVPPQNSINLATKIPNAKLEIVKGGGHMFFIEKAAEFNKIVTDFIKN